MSRIDFANLKYLIFRTAFAVQTPILDYGPQLPSTKRTIWIVEIGTQKTVHIYIYILYKLHFVGYIYIYIYLCMLIDIYNIYIYVSFVGNGQNIHILGFWRQGHTFQGREFFGRLSWASKKLLKDGLGFFHFIIVMVLPNHPFVHRVFSWNVHHPFWGTTIFGNTWWFPIFFIFTPDPWGHDPIWRLHIFQMDWFNHHLVDPWFK